MAEQKDEVPFEQRLNKLERAVARAVHVAAQLKIASRPEPNTSDFGLAAWRKKHSKKDDVVVRPADLKPPADAPMEATQWVAGLSNFYWALSRASEEKIPDKNMLMRQLERQVDKLAGEFDRASDRPTDLIKEVSSKATRQAKIDPRIVEQLETRMREKLDHATGELVPGESPYGVFTGLVANKLLGFTQDPTLSQTGEELGKSIQSGLLVPAEPSSVDELAAVPAPGKELAPRPSDPGTDDLTPIDLDEIDTADTRGALRRFDPALLEQTPSRALEASRGPAEDGPVAEPDDVARTPSREPDEDEIVAQIVTVPEPEPEPAPTIDRTPPLPPPPPPPARESYFDDLELGP